MSSSILIASCTNIPIKDSQFCGDLGKDGAHCNQIMSKNPIDIPKDEWDKKRFGMICTDSEGFENWRTAIQVMCEKLSCSWEVKQKIEEGFSNLAEVRAKAGQEEPTNHLPKTPFEL